MPILSIRFESSSLIEAKTLVEDACPGFDSEVAARDLRETAEDFMDSGGDASKSAPAGDDFLVCARNTGLRGVFVHTREDEVHVAIATPASFADYELFARICLKLREYTACDGEFSEDCRELEVYCSPANGIRLFSREWAEQCMTADYVFAVGKGFHGRLPEYLDCFNFPFVFGAKMMAEFGLYPLRRPSQRGINAYRRMLDYAVGVQWEFAGTERTASGKCMVRRVEDPAEREALENNDFTEEDARRLLAEIAGGDHGARLFTICAFPVGAPAETVAPPRLIAYGDYISFFDLESHEQLALVPFACLPGIVDEIPGRFIDEAQYVADEPVDEEHIAAMLAASPRYTPVSPFAPPLFPGTGISRGQRTFVFFWNPADSDLKTPDFRRAIPRMQLLTLRLRLADYGEARMGDRAFFVCRSPRMPNGIVMSGILTSNPYRHDDPEAPAAWYADFRPNLMMDPRNPSLLTTDILADAIPGFDWQGSAGGVRLADEDARTLEELWAPQLDYAVSTFIDSDGLDKTLNAIAPRESRY